MSIVGERNQIADGENAEGEQDNPYIRNEAALNLKIPQTVSDDKAAGTDKTDAETRKKIN